MNYKSTIIILVIFLFLGYQQHCTAESIKKPSIIGIIVDFASNNPIEYANLVLTSTTDSSIITGTISAADGSFRIEDIKKGNYNLRIHFIGYQIIVMDNIEINSKNEVIDLGTIKLKPTSIDLEETEIVANNNYIDFKIDKKVINVSEHINADGGAIVEALHNVPSVQVDAGGTVSIRGSTSFTLLIDGRPTVMSPSDALNTIQASTVDKIEVITNPSVKYDADGTSGIINLIMKKQKNTGVSGQATLMLATGDKYTTNIAFNKRTDKLNANLGISYSNKRKRTESRDDREVFAGDSTYYQNINSDRDIYRKNYKLNGGVSYDLNQYNSFNLNFDLGQWEFDRNIDSKIRLYNSFDTTKRYFTSKETYIVTNDFGSADFGYKRNFSKKGHKLEADVYFSKVNNKTPNNISEYEFDKLDNEIPDSANYYNIYNASNRNHLRFKTDYTLPISDATKFEAGYQNDSKNSSTNYSYKFRNSLNQNWNSDSTLSGKLDFSRMVNSVYANVSTSVKGIQIQAGLRMEYVVQTLQQIELQKNYDYNDLNLFPSVHLSKSLKNEQQLSLSYSRRINRPNEWMLLPAVNSTGRDMLQFGNPELKPDFTSSFEFGYYMRTKLIMLSAELYVRNTKNSITPAMMESDGNFYQSYENLDKELSTGIDLMSNINIQSWWRMNISANAYYYKLTGTLNSGYVVDNSSLAWNGRFRTTFIVKKKTYLEFMAVYYGPSILTQGKTQDFYYFDFFLKRNFFNRKLTVELRSHNTFDTGIYIEDTKGVDFKTHTWFKYEGPTFMMTLTYKLNNFKLKRSVNNVDMNFDSGLDQ